MSTNTGDMLGILHSYVCEMIQKTFTVLGLLVTDQRKELRKKTVLVLSESIPAFFPCFAEILAM